MVVPLDATLKWEDTAGSTQLFPNESVEAVDKPQFPAFLVYKKADGTFAWSTLDTLLGEIKTAIAAQQTDALTNTQLRASAVPVSAASLPLPSDAATQTTLAAVLAAIQAQASPLTDAQLRASAVAVSGTVAVSNNTFARLSKREWADTEEVRFDIPASVASSAVYTGAATAGSLESDAAWAVVRTDFDANGNPSRQRYRSGLVWTNRATGWT